MLKKKIATVLAAAAMTLTASSAFAAFADLDLIRVVYERTTGTTELGTDLGVVKNADGSIKTGTYAGSLPTVSTANNLYAAYFALDRTTGELWVSGSSDITKAPVAVGSKGFTSTLSGTTNLYSYYNLLTPDANGVVTAAKSDSRSYTTKLSASQGALANAINIATRVNTEAKLASLVTGSATSVTQNLYYFANAKVANSKGVAVATITTFDDGHTVVATPIPAAAYLLGSGLMGLVGLRRRNKA